MASCRPESLSGPEDPGVPGADTDVATPEWPLECDRVDCEPLEEAGEE